MRQVPLLRILVDVMFFLLLWTPVPLIFVHIQPWSHGFFCSDISIRHPFKKGTISSAVLYSVGILVPTILILAVEAYRTYFIDPRVFHNGERPKVQYAVIGRPVPPYLLTLYIHLGYFFFGMSLNFLLTALGKHSLGRLRPHFLDVCKPNLTLYCSGTDPYAYVMPEHLVCTGDPEKLYLQARMIWPVGGLLTKHVLQFGAALLAIACGFTRVSDYKHHWSDVLAGFILGTIMAVVTVFGMAGMFRRPHWVFARPAPYDSRMYTGGQLIGDFGEDTRGLEQMSILVEQKKEIMLTKPDHSTD